MRQVLVDASVFITLAEIDRERLLEGIRGEVRMPEAVSEEIIDDPASSKKMSAVYEEEWIRIVPRDYQLKSHVPAFKSAAEHLGETDADWDWAGVWSGGDMKWSGDVALLARALAMENAVVVTDDKPLRKTCKALGIDVSGSIGVIIAAVERDELSPEDAKDALIAMDEVGARLSARLLRRAERLIDEASED
jgi:predicted nucleic acid-binding protein